MSATTLSLESRAKLSDGNLIPRLGLGVYEMTDNEASRAVAWALEAGYRHFDCAEWYYNEQAVGSAINRFLETPSCPIKRSDIFYCTKLQSNNGYDAAKRSISQSLQKCGLGYIDLYLIHSPYGGKAKRLESWKAIQEAKDQGLIKGVGVSNYAQRHIQELLDSNPKHRPTINQCDLHPFMARLQLVEFCRSNGIEMECWGPLVRAERFGHPVILQIAKKHSATPAQVLIRFSLQRGYITIPKSVSRDRIKENADVFNFQLDQPDMDQLLSLDEYLVTE
ncbi:potential aldo/keto reductase [Pseudozyma hubeiensis SY62]|uniref:Potential aldo/keto reductase n=1 Tax=Pseudozyma hubeiensis (strain SY62) TaxID=1305764 RepID=R9P365_PSEHS|nr:potential aldo/keto reductase [Pseudozyma hubeiensis SY62]GAC95744.1 potential aldo/keto reductase [Pseudozyma hubeiensis SY62]